MVTQMGGEDECIRAAYLIISYCQVIFLAVFPKDFPHPLFSNSKHSRMPHVCTASFLSWSLKANSHMPCRAHAVPLAFSDECRVLRESPRGNRKYPNC
jgi:hypothetical protein